MTGGFRLSRPLAFLVIGLASCQGRQPSTSAAPAAASTSPARVVLKLYSGSSTGLVVGEAPSGDNPGPLLPGQAFAENPGLGRTFIWSFAPGATVLDASCAVITHTQAINIANTPVANAAIFISRPPTLKIQLLPARDAAASKC